MVIAGLLNVFAVLLFTCAFLSFLFHQSPPPSSSANTSLRGPLNMFGGNSAQHTRHFSMMHQSPPRSRPSLSHPFCDLYFDTSARRRWRVPDLVVEGLLDGRVLLVAEVKKDVEVQGENSDMIHCISFLKLIVTIDNFEISSRVSNILLLAMCTLIEYTPVLADNEWFE